MYDPNTHRRKSIRLPGYDYSTEGFYFITICTKDKKCIFGKIVDGEMILNEAGKIVKEEWLQTINIRKGEAKLHKYVIMPNHFHAIIEICRGVSHTPECINANNSGCNQGVCNTPYAPTINIKNYRCHYTWIQRSCFTKNRLFCLATQLL